MKFTLVIFVIGLLVLASGKQFDSWSNLIKFNQPFFTVEAVIPKGLELEDTLEDLGETLDGVTKQVGGLTDNLLGENGPLGSLLGPQGPLKGLLGQGGPLAGLLRKRRHVVMIEEAPKQDSEPKTNAN